MQKKVKSALVSYFIICASTELTVYKYWMYDKVIKFLLTFTFYRWFKSPSSGGLFATTVERKATFLQTFWNRWGATGLWKIPRWANRQLLLLWVTADTMCDIFSLCSPRQWNSRGPVTLDMNSRPAEVKAWLDYKGFSRLWVNSGTTEGFLSCWIQLNDVRRSCFFSHAALRTPSGCWLVNSYWTCLRRI